MDRLGYSQINFLFILTLIQRDDGQKKQTLEERTTEPCVTTKIQRLQIHY